MSTIVTLLALSGPVVTWLWTTARWRSRIDAHDAAWRRAHAELLAKAGNLQHDAARARMYTTQLTQATDKWSDGYKQGCNDMIKAVVALNGGLVMSQQIADDAGDTK